MTGLLLALTVCLCALQAAAYVTDVEFKQVLQTLKKLEKDEEQRSIVDSVRDSVVDCKAEGAGCRGVVRCCGTLQCFWKQGFSARKEGKCVTCVKKGEKCQRDSQCCGSPQALQCNKGNALWVDGTCEVYRSSGSCYRDGQCVNDCNKSWWRTHGSCQ